MPWNRCLEILTDRRVRWLMSQIWINRRRLVGSWVIHSLEQISQLSWLLIISSNPRNKCLSVSILPLIVLKWALAYSKIIVIDSSFLLRHRSKSLRLEILPLLLLIQKVFVVLLLRLINLFRLSHILSVHCSLLIISLIPGLKFEALAWVWTYRPCETDYQAILSPSAPRMEQWTLTRSLDSGWCIFLDFRSYS